MAQKEKSGWKRAKALSNVQKTTDFLIKSKKRDKKDRPKPVFLNSAIMFV